MIGRVINLLYEIVKEEHLAERNRYSSAAGHDFENSVADKLRQLEPVISDIKTRRPTIYPTLSGIRTHQYDCSFNFNSTTYVIECKKQGQAASKNQIYYFNSTILDHIMGIKSNALSNDIRGIFLSTTDLDGKSIIYAMTNAIKVITPNYPPLELMISRADGSSDMANSLKRILSQLPARNPLFCNAINRMDPTPAELFENYKALLIEWYHRKEHKTDI